MSEASRFTSLKLLRGEKKPTAKGLQTLRGLESLPQLIIEEYALHIALIAQRYLQLKTAVTAYKKHEMSSKFEHLKIESAFGLPRGNEWLV